VGRPGSVRKVALTACDGLLQGALITGHDRVYLGMLAWINSGAARRIVPYRSTPPTLQRGPGTTISNGRVTEF
jgi:hypothetical protein